MTRSSKFGRRFATLVVLVMVIGAAMTIVGGTAAFAEAGGPAACMGHEASAISPPGSSDELPGAMPSLIAFFQQAFPGTPVGAIVSQIAKVHAGSHEACDEAFE